MTQQQFKPITVAGTLYWAFLDRTPENSDRYSVDICNLSGDAVKALEKFGVKVKNKKDERENYITARSTKEIVPVDSQGAPFDLGGALVGNGSKAQAVLGFYTHKLSNMHGTGVGLNRLILKELVPYGTGAVSEDEVL